MADQYLEYVIFLEKTLADYYERIKDQPQFERIKTVLEFMETHSRTHGEQIEDADREKKPPSFSKELILNYHNNVVKNVLEKLTDEKDLAVVLETLAHSEEALGKLYLKIVDHLNELGDYYKDLAGDVKRIAGEENDHRDLLMKDREQILKKQK